MNKVAIILLLSVSFPAFAELGKTDKALYDCLKGLNSLDRQSKALFGKSRFLKIDNSEHISGVSKSDASKLKLEDGANVDWAADDASFDKFANGRYFINKDSIVFDPDGTGELMVNSTWGRDFKGGSQLKKIQSGDGGAQFAIRQFIATSIQKLKAKIENKSQVSEVSKLPPASAEKLKAALKTCGSEEVVQNTQDEQPSEYASGKARQAADDFFKKQYQGHSYIDFIGNPSAARSGSMANVQQ
jgi:hypothetical protein